MVVMGIQIVNQILLFGILEPFTLKWTPNQIVRVFSNQPIVCSTESSNAFFTSGMDIAGRAANPCTVPGMRMRWRVQINETNNATYPCNP